MHLREKSAQLPLAPGVYLYKDDAGRVIYVGKAKSLRLRVRSYFSEERQADVKTGTLLSEARDIDYILVDNEKEALALENNLIKQYKPRFNVLLRDDKTYPNIKLTKEKYPRVYVTRRLRKDGSTYYGPYFPANLAHRLVHFIHRHFLVPSCKVDLTRYHPKPCLQYHIHRCLGPCVLRSRMEAAAEAMRFEEAASLRDLLTTVEEIEQRQKMAAVRGDDIDIFGVYAEPPLIAVNVFHLRNGQIVDRREFFWEDQTEFDEPQLLSTLLSQLYLDQQYIPTEIHVPVDFEDRAALEELLSEKRGGRRVEIRTPQRGQKKALMDLTRGAGGTPGRTEPAASAVAYRVFRYLAHSGHRQGGQHGGLGRRPHEEIGLSQVHHPHGGRQRRFRQHARGSDAPLFPVERGRRSHARPGAD